MTGVVAGTVREHVTEVDVRVVAAPVAVFGAVLTRIDLSGLCDRLCQGNHLVLLAGMKRHGY